MLINKLLIIWYPFDYPHGTARAKKPFKGLVGAGSRQESNPRPLEPRVVILSTCGIYATKQSQLNLHKLMNQRLSRDSCTRLTGGGVNTKHNGRAAVNNK